MPAITAQARRVRAHTPRSAQQCIDQQLERSLHHPAQHPEEIDARLAELEREWDIERTLEANAATISLASITFGLLTGRRTSLLAGAVAGFLLQHAVQGWCPPVSVFRRLGVRTAAEIDQERYALKALRGDFDDLPPDEEAGARAAEAVRAVRV